MTGFHGLHQYHAGASMPRHRHAEPYMAVVVEGGYLEAGDAGRIEARPGDVILHGAFEAHQDHFEPGGARVLNLPLGQESRSDTGRLEDVDAIVRIAERDLLEASTAVRLQMTSGNPFPGDWPDLLASALRNDPGLAIAEWADRIGLAPASVSRGFARAYGVSPKRYRLELRTLRALSALNEWRGTLAALAAEHGFADQAHFARSAVALTGRTPLLLRNAAR